MCADIVFAVSTQTTPTVDADTQAQLASIGTRLAAQEEQLQAQLQSQLSSRAPSAPFGGQGGLAALGEEAELGNGSQPPAVNRQGGPRFAGNAAFQSAVARHAAQNSGSQQQQQQQQGGDRNSLAHARQLSLQGRFADLGYNVGAQPPADIEEMTDDGASSIADYMGAGQFDPTRRQMQQQAEYAEYGQPHRRAGTEMPAYRQQAFRPGHMQTGSYGGAGQPQMQQQQQQPMYAEQLALQQQIEVSQFNARAL